jgi:hypothetical protein
VNLSVRRAIKAKQQKQKEQAEAAVVAAAAAAAAGGGDGGDDSDAEAADYERRPRAAEQQHKGPSTQVGPLPWCRGWMVAGVGLEQRCQ